MIPKIKICGIKEAAFARRAEELGVDYLGFIFAKRSPRRVTPEKAAAIVATLSGRAKCVGVFTDTPVADILAIAAGVPLDVVQLHSSDYGADEIQRLKAAGLEVWRLYGAPSDLEYGADGILLDGKEPVRSDGSKAIAGGVERTGGTGRLADWKLAAELVAAGVRVVLAGGISAANAARAATTGCAVLDVNSSLETVPGVKSIERLARFMPALRGV